MKFEYINKDGNKVETEDLNEAPSNLERIDGVYFEKREVEVVTKKEPKSVITLEVKEEVVNIEDDTETKALAFLKDAKVRAAHLLKGQNLIDKAVANGFILN